MSQHSAMQLSSSWESVSVQSSTSSPATHLLVRHRALVIAAHPDDETIGCGGTIAKMVRDGWHVDVAIMTKATPELSRRYADPQEADAIREREADKACDVLGVQDLFFANFEEVHLSTHPFPAIVDWIGDLIRERQHELILTHSTGDLHQDHRALAEATVIATRPYVRPPSLRWVISYRSDVLPFLTSPFRPSLFVDVTSTITAKLRALDAYKSELREAPHPRSHSSISAWARFVGSMCGMEFAEAFETVWEVWP